MLDLYSLRLREGVGAKRGTDGQRAKVKRG